MRETSRTAAAAVFGLIAIFVLAPGALAVQQSTEQLSTLTAPGYSSTLTWALFSDKTYDTFLSISSDGDGSSFLSYSQQVGLRPAGTAYVTITVNVPQEYPAPTYPDYKTVTPVIRAKEVVYTTSGSAISLGEVSKVLIINITRPPAHSNYPTSGGTQEGTSNQTTTNGTAATSSQSNFTTQPTANQTSSGTSTSTTQPAVGTFTNNTTKPEGSSANQTFVTANNTQQATTASPAPLPVGTLKIVNSTTGTSFVPQFASNVRSEEISKIAREIQDLSERRRSETAGNSDRHFFNFTRTDIKKINIEFARNVSNIQISVKTLAIVRVNTTELNTGENITSVVDETTATGTVITRPSVLPEEKISPAERNLTIEVAPGVVLPDIEQQTVKEETVRKTETNEVVRTITKNKAYKYLEISLEGAAAADVKKATVNFTVEKSWLAANKISDPSLVRLNRYTDRWVGLPTRQAGEDATSYYFSAETSGFSFFVITAAITADITTPISIEIPKIEEQTAEEQADIVGDLLGTSKPQPILIVNISWILAVAVLGMVILVKYNSIKRALSSLHAKEDKVKQLEAEKSRYNRMKEETTKRFYKRIISEEEFKNLVMEYDKQLIRIDTEIGELKGKKK